MIEQQQLGYRQRLAALAAAEVAEEIGQLGAFAKPGPDRLLERVAVLAGRVPEHLERVDRTAIGVARIELRCSSSATVLRIHDDGNGFDVAARWDASYGLRSMAERAELVGGRLTVTSRPGVGTTVTATVPSGLNTPCG